jgi:hypothetical protein
MDFEVNIFYLGAFKADLETEIQKWFRVTFNR